MANNTNPPGNWRDSRGNSIPLLGVKLFVSIHANAGVAAARGTEVFYYENNDLRSRRSKNIAVLMLQMYIRHTRPAFSNASSRGIKQDTESPHMQLAVLRSTTMPAILVETEFITNTTYCNTFTQATYKDSAGGGIKQGVCWTYPPATSPFPLYCVDVEMLGNFTSGTSRVVSGECFVARNVTRRVTNNYYVEGSGTWLDISPSLFGEKALAVVDDRLRVKARNGGFITIGSNSITVLGEGAELLAGSGGVIEKGGGEIAFLGEGSCIGLQQGTLRLQDNAELRVNNQGILASFEPSTIELGNNARIIIEANSKLAWNANSNMIMGSGAAIEIYGTVVVADEVNFEIPVGATVVFHPGAQLKVGHSSVIVEGTLSAIGTAGNPVTFSRLNPSTIWGGVWSWGTSPSTIINLDHVNITGVYGSAIHVGNTVSLTMQNCNISNSDWGVVIVEGATGLPQPPIQLLYNTFTSSTGTAVYLYNSSNVRLENNQFIGSNAGDGVMCVNSSPIMLRNTIESFSTGLYCMANAEPMLEDGQFGGNNVIRYNAVGVRCESGSDANLGTSLPPGWDDGGQNSIWGNTANDVVLRDKVAVFAQLNWWGSREDPPGVFDIEPKSELFYQPFLYDDPNPTARPLAGVGTNTKGSIENEPLTPRVQIPELMKQAMRERRRGNFSQADALLRAIVAHPTLPQFAKEWALGQLLAVGQRMPQPNVSRFLSSLIRTQPTLTRRINAILPFGYLAERNPAQMLAAFEANIRQYPNSELARTGAFGKFVHALHSVRDTTEARNLLSQLRANYPTSKETQTAVELLRLHRAFGAGQSLVGAGAAARVASTQMTETKPTAFAIHQNHPNPFNPTTTINFDLPEPSHVLLVVYDVLGRTVVELAKGLYDAGYQSATWNASTSASGVYFARFTAIPQGGTSGSIRLNRVSKLILAK